MPRNMQAMVGIAVKDREKTPLADSEGTTVSRFGDARLFLLCHRDGPAVGPIATPRGSASAVLEPEMVAMGIRFRAE